ncbi:MAG: phosphotransferase [Neobacillus sp.]
MQRCRVMTMKVMTIKKTGDDDYFIRLLSYFQSQFKEEIFDMMPIRNNVFFIKTAENKYIIKGYKSYNRLKLQEAFTATLKKEGFHQTYEYLHPEVHEPLHFEQMHFGCLEYIPSHKTHFSFHTHKNRQEGIELLSHFHQVTSKVEARYRTLIPKGNLLEKWRQRANLFVSNLPFIRYFVSESYITEVLEWADWSLQKMTDKQLSAGERLVVLHGDVAHHNFLRASNGSLYLIDFDLISIGPESFDYLQYANRILPYLDWSFDRLAHFSKYEELRKDEVFLAALAYPADIFREWNRLVREKSYTNHEKYKQVMDLTIGQFHQRKKFFLELKKRMK